MQKLNQTCRLTATRGITWGCGTFLVSFDESNSYGEGTIQVELHLNTSQVFWYLHRRNSKSHQVTSYPKGHEIEFILQ